MICLTPYFQYKKWTSARVRSEVCVVFNLNLSRGPFLGQVTFHLLLIGLQTLVSVYSESFQTLFPSICVPPSEVSVLFDFTAQRVPTLGILQTTGQTGKVLIS